jgi:EmrB/QacA subfamily drug resistance transporter
VAIETKEEWEMSDTLRAPSRRNDDVPMGRDVREASASAPDGRRWTSLIFIALAQLMVALDATIVSIALPSAQSALHVTDAERQWVITAYTLAFGGLLLLGGRVGDQLGRKRTFLLGLAGFAAASALGGAAVNFGMLIGARALQGAFAALLTPTALSLLAVTFTEPRERAKAFAVYGSIAGSGAAVGLLLGGVLTQYFSWRWCLFVNLPIAVVAAVGGWMVLSDTSAARRGRLDIAGVAFATIGLVALVFATTEAVTDGWGSPIVVGSLVASGVLLAMFVAWQRHTTNPLLPLRIVADRNRGGSYLAVLLTIAGMFGAFLFLTYYMQVVLGYSPLKAGLAFLPLTIASQFGSWAIASRLMPHVPARALMVPGLLVAAAGMALLTQLQVGSSFVLLILPAEVLLGAGIACVMVPAFSTGTLGVDPREAGVAAATVNTASQIGASIGTALLNTVAASATVAYFASHRIGSVGRSQGLVHGYSVATEWGTAIFVLAAVIVAVMVNAGKPSARGAGPSEHD